MEKIIRKEVKLSVFEKKNNKEQINICDSLITPDAAVIFEDFDADKKVGYATNLTVRGNYLYGDLEIGKEFFDNAEELTCYPKFSGEIKDNNGVKEIKISELLSFGIGKIGHAHEELTGNVKLKRVKKDFFENMQEWLKAYDKANNSSHGEHIWEWMKSQPTGG